MCEWVSQRAKSLPGTAAKRKVRARLQREGGGDVLTYTSKRRFCFSSKKKSSTNFLTKSGFSVLSITSVRPNCRGDREEKKVNSVHIDLCLRWEEKVKTGGSKLSLLRWSFGGSYRSSEKLDEVTQLDSCRSFPPSHLCVTERGFPVVKETDFRQRWQSSSGWTATALVSCCVVQTLSNTV